MVSSPFGAAAATAADKVSEERGVERPGQGTGLLVDAGDGVGHQGPANASEGAGAERPRAGTSGRRRELRPAHTVSGSQAQADREVGRAKHIRATLPG